MSNQEREVVITGIGVVSPIGIGRDAFAASLAAGRGGIRSLSMLPPGSVPAWIGGEVVGFDPKDRINRKALKLMSWDIQAAVVASQLAVDDARLAAGAADPERMGVVFGTEMIQSVPEELEPTYRNCLVDGRFDFSRWGPAAMSNIHPLWFLKHLPNMPACHITIQHDIRGPNNTITESDVSDLLAIIEAAKYIQRGWTDIMITGGVGSRLRTTPFLRSFIGQVSRRNAEPERACRPFDRDRDGAVNGEGAAAFILEARETAVARGAKVLGRILGFGAAYDPQAMAHGLSGTAIQAAIRAALRDARLSPAAVGHVNAQGMSMTAADRVEAQAIRAVLGDVPVTAPASFFGQSGAGGGALMLAASVLGLADGSVPFTLNYDQPDPDCPVNVVHARALSGAKPVAVKLSHAWPGQVAALVVAGPN